MKKIFIFLFLVSITFANELIVGKNGNSTYIQQTEFLVAQGESVVGPVSLLPNAKTDALMIKSNDVKILGYIASITKQSTIENLVGKTISIEGDGRLIRGTVVSIKDGFITIDTKSGIVVTTLPTFPSRISSSLRWQEISSPYLTIKLNSDKPKTAIIFIKYPVSDISWDVSYIYDMDSKKLTGFYIIKNDTPITLKDITLSILDESRYIQLYMKTYLEPFAQKHIKFAEINNTEIGKKIDTNIYLPNGKVAVYKNGIFTGYKNLLDKIIK